MTRAIDRPEPGLFEARLTSGGPIMPAAIYRPCPIEMPIDEPWQWVDRWHRLEAHIAGKPASVHQVWTGGRRLCWTERGDHYWRMALVKWAEDYAPHVPEANPRDRVDLNRMKAIF